MLTPVSHHLLSMPPAVRTNALVTASHHMSTQGQVPLAQILALDEEEFAVFVTLNRDDHGTIIADSITDCHTAPMSLKQELWERLRRVETRNSCIRFIRIRTGQCTDLSAVQQLLWTLLLHA